MKEQLPHSIFPEINIFPRITRVAKVVGNLFCMHQLASHGDHLFPHDPLLSPDEPIKQWGSVPDIQGLDVGINQMHYSEEAGE